MTKPIRKVRLLVTLSCKRNCSYCVNKYESIMANAKYIDSLKGFENYEEVCISGGEPTLNIPKLTSIIKKIKNKNPNIKVYLYSAAYYTNWLRNKDLVSNLDGIHFTLHSFEEENKEQFKSFQYDLMWHTNVAKRISVRLYISPAINGAVEIIPSLYSRVEVKPWMPEGECPVPEDKLLILEKPYGVRDN